MAWLYCEKHGDEKLEEAKNTDWSNYPEEYLKVAKGLLMDNFLCDRCNKVLAQGDVAVLVCSFLINRRDDMEMRYFKKPIVYYFSVYPFIETLV